MTADSQDIASTRDKLDGLLTMLARASFHDHADFAWILPGALAAAAANVGRHDALLAGRPGSWESAYLRDLLRGAMGDDPNYWWSLITEPIIIRLNVAELIEDPDLHPDLARLDKAQSRLDAVFGDHLDGDTNMRRYDAAVATLTERYTASYDLYSERFAAAVAAIGTELTLPPEAVVDADPISRWRDDTAIHNSVCTDSTLVNELWEFAHAVVSLPDVDIHMDRTERIF